MMEEQEEKKIVNLPPLPENAIEFDQLNLESMVEQVKEGLIEFAKEAGISPNDTEQEIPSIEQDKSSEEDPPIVDDPSLTPSDSEEEFDSSSTQNALDDFDSEGGVSKATNNGPTLSEARLDETKIINSNEIKLGNKISDFNPGTVQNALIDNEKEGGVVSNKSTGNLKTPYGDHSREGFQIKSGKESIDSEKYRVYGFIVQYETKDSNNLNVIETKQVSDYYNSLMDAMVSVNGSKYLITNPDKSRTAVDIVSGLPNISFKDRCIYIYKETKKTGIGGSWKKA